MRWLLLVCVLEMACTFEDHLVPCGDLSCPAGTTCNATLSVCVTPDQVAACEGQPDGTVCVAGPLSGTCISGACLASVCGDRVVEAGEACDDGNTTNGDGCNAVCTSDETCGNGFVDVGKGEVCDDSNLISNDGCDSGCSVETAQWTYDGVAPAGLTQGQCAYDEAEHRAICFSNGLTWTWDGSKWTLILVSKALLGSWGWSQLFFDVSRGKMMLVGAMGGTKTENLLEWNAGNWVPVQLESQPEIENGVATFAKGLAFIVGKVVNTGAPVVYTLDPADGKFLPVPAPSASLANGYAITYDTQRDVLVLGTGAATSNPTMSEFDGVSWVETTTVATFDRDFSLFFDPSVAAVIALGGKSGNTEVEQLSSWNGLAWTLIEPMPKGRTRPTVIWDAGRARRVVLGGYGGPSGTYLDEVLEWNGGWEGPFLGAPRSWSGGYAFDPVKSRLVQYGGFIQGSQTNEAWTWDRTSWHQLPSTGPILSSMIAVYDPNRGGVVVTRAAQGTWIVKDDTVTVLENLGGAMLNAMTYVPSRRSIIGIAPNNTFELGHDSTMWLRIGLAPNISFTSIAYDARSDRLLAEASDGRVFIAPAGTADWSPTLSPGVGFDVVANERRGSVELLGSTDVSWERFGSTWLENAGLDIPVIGKLVYAPDRGELMIVGTLYGHRVIARRRFVGQSDDEVCTAAGDADADGLAGCDDPDCFWMCTPCPPYATCP